MRLSAVKPGMLIYNPIEKRHIRILSVHKKDSWIGGGYVTWLKWGTVCRQCNSSGKINLVIAAGQHKSVICNLCGGNSKNRTCVQILVPAKFTIQKLKKHEINKAVNIIKTHWPEYEIAARKELQEMFTQALIRPTFLTAKIGKKIVGVAAFSASWMDYSIYELFWANVLEEYRNLGIGTALVHARLDLIAQNSEAKIALLTTRYTQHYTNLGFKTIGDELMAFRIRSETAN